MKFEILLPDVSGDTSGNSNTFFTSLSAIVDYSYIPLFHSTAGTLAQQLLVWGIASASQMASINTVLQTFNTAMGTSAILESGAYLNVMSQVTSILNVASAAQSAYSSGHVAVDMYSKVFLDINVTAFTGGTNPTVVFKVSRLGADGVLYPVWQNKPLAVVGTISQDFGTSVGSRDVGDIMQVDMITTGAPTSVTFSLSLKGRSFQ